MNTSRISIANGGLMITTAVLVDIADFFLALGILGFLVDIPASITFGIWFSHCDVSLLHPDRAVGYLATIGAEAVPGIDDVPWWTITVTMNVLREWRSPDEL